MTLDRGERCPAQPGPPFGRRTWSVALRVRSFWRGGELVEQNKRFGPSRHSRQQSQSGVRQAVPAVQAVQAAHGRTQNVTAIVASTNICSN
jgi:hypothetical protein